MELGWYDKNFTWNYTSPIQDISNRLAKHGLNGLKTPKLSVKYSILTGETFFFWHVYKQLSSFVNAYFIKLLYTSWVNRLAFHIFDLWW